MKMNTELLAKVLDELIPPRPDGRLPGAGTLGLGGVVEHAAAGTPDIAQVLAAGFTTLERLAQRSDPKGFAALPPGTRVATLRDLEEAEPMFLPTLMTLACVGYYSDERVITVINGNARPPHPLGYQIEPDDLSLLEAVRARGKLYRES